MNLPTIHQLRRAGYKVRLDHYRNVIFNAPGQPHDQGYAEYQRVTRLAKKAREFSVIAPKGGRTELWVTTPQGKTGNALAMCNEKDRFNRKLAIRICIGRLIKLGVIPAKLDLTVPRNLNDLD